MNLIKKHTHNKHNKSNPFSVILPAVGVFLLMLGLCQKYQKNVSTERFAANNSVDKIVEQIVSSEVNKEFFFSNACPRFQKITQTGIRSGEVFGAVKEASLEHKVDESLILAVMAVESRCRSKVISGAGAVGLMQLMPGTARWLGVKNSFSIQDNVMGGAKYLSYLLGRFDGNLELALAAYNAGPSVVHRHNAIPPYRETRNYVRKVINYYRQLRNA